jgi:hypothetical protein
MHYKVEILSLVFDFAQYFGDVLCNYQNDNRVAATSRGAAWVFRKPHGSDDGAGM